MEIIIGCTLISAFLNVAFVFGFWCGMKHQKKQTSKDGIELTQDNQEAIKQLVNWMNFKG